MAKKKLPAFQFYTGDWLKDPALSMCSPETRGIWIDLLCAMHELDRCGQITGTPEQLARISRCTSVQLIQAIDELQLTNSATVTNRNGKVTLTNRRMNEEYKERKKTALRVRKHRKKQKIGTCKKDSNGECNKDVTPYTSSSTSNKKNTIKKIVTEIDFSNSSFFNISDDLKNRWASTYPRVGIDGAIAKMEAWLSANPEKRPKNYHSFIVNWLARDDKEKQNNPERSDVDEFGYPIEN